MPPTLAVVASAATGEPNAEVERALGVRRLAGGDVAQALEALAALDAPRPDAQAPVEDAAEHDREEELREPPRRDTEDRSRSREPEAGERRRERDLDDPESA